MKLLLITFNQQDVGECKRAPTDISAIGTRYLSSYLKREKHKVNILFLPKRHGETETPKDIKQINDLISKLKPDFIGLSLMSIHFLRAKQLTRAVKNEFRIPMIWGGFHPTTKPIDCLEYVDFVCVGEGELAMKQLLDAGPKDNDDFNIRGIWYKKNGQIINQGVAPLLENIDSAPFPDYDLGDHYIVHKHKLMPLTMEIFKQYYPASHGDYRLISSRGCPHACSYCGNSALRLMYRGAHFRMRSVESVIDEMLTIRAQLPFIKFFKINDDTFAANSVDWLREFGRQYKVKINLPFYCLVSSLTINKEKLEILVNAGLTVVQMGLQSGSDRVNKEIYLRNVTSKNFLEAIGLLENYGPRLKILLDVIVDNPYEKEEDVLESIKVLNQLKRGFNLALYSLVFYPGTELYNRVIKDKIPGNQEEYLNKEFHVFKPTYFNKLLYLIPRLSVETVENFIKKRHRLFVRIRLGLLFFIYIRKNKMPFWFLKILSKIKRGVEKKK